MRYRRLLPRPKHESADFTEQQEWKKKLATVVDQVQKDYPDADVELWAMDEHRREENLCKSGQPLNTPLVDCGKQLFR